MPLPRALSKAVVGAYVRAYDVDLDEAEPLNGAGAYPTFDAFFTRPLRRGARSWHDAAGALGSPADGHLVATGTVDDDCIEVKGRPYRAADLLLSADVLARHRGSSFAVIYLSPRDYHRVHAPADCSLVEVRSRQGDLFPVNSISERHIPDYLVINRRVAIDLDSAEHGFMTLVMVAAMIVGRITVVGVEGRDVPFGRQRFDPAIQLRRGEELATFHLGSTAVIFGDPAGPCFDRPLGPIQVGNRLTRAEGGGARRQVGDG